MRFILAAIFVVWGLLPKAQQSLQPIGTWREHLPYNSAIDLAAGTGKIYCATPYSLYIVDLNGAPNSTSLERMSRVTGLNETGVNAIAYDAINEKLFIAYNNSNIDIVYKNNIYNIPDIKRDNIAGDKSIYQIYPLGRNYYLSTGLGILVIDGDKYEVMDSWFIGNAGNQVKVSGFTSDANFYYAATEEGLKVAPVNISNPANFANWQTVGPANGLSPGTVQNVFMNNGSPILQKNDSLFKKVGNNWDFFYYDGWPLVNSNSSSGKILLFQHKPGGEGRVLILNEDATIARLLEQPGVISYPRKGIIRDNDPWIADQFGGLTRFQINSFETSKPNSPQSTASGEMTVYNNVIYATAGEVNDSWNYQYNGNGFFYLKGGVWTNINRFVFPQLDSLLDFITIAIDPRDESIWAGSYGGGLLHKQESPVFEIFKQGFIGPAIGDPASYRVSGLAFDKENNLWVANYGASQPLRVRKNDGNWINFSLPFFLNENAVSQIVIDDNNYKWIVSPKGNGLICFDHGSFIDNPGDDRWKIYRGGFGNGNLPNSEVLCVAKDKSGFIWVGTTDGIGVIQCAQDVFTGQGCEAILPVVSQGNFANFLFKGEEVRDIAIDGADRKWVATKNGVWLISATGEKIIYQFTETNSPLLSSDVKKITIDGRTGEVYFATMKGICSFRSTATEGGAENKDVLVFPNPVPPGYSGAIAIRGLVNNAIVKITELDGRLVYQTRALGGQAVWDGRDYKGRKISTGIYLVLISDDTGTENKTSKIVFIGK